MAQRSFGKITRLRAFDANQLLIKTGVEVREAVGIKTH